MNGGKSVVVAVGGAQEALAKLIADRLGAAFYMLDDIRFADGESIIEIAELSAMMQNKSVSLVFRFDLAHRSINDQLLHLLFIANKIASCQPVSLDLVTPYLPYTRQGDDIFTVLGKFVSAAGVDRLFCGEPHDESCTKRFGVSLHAIPFISLWREVVREAETRNLCFLSPDRGGINRVEALASLFDTTTAFVEKERVGYDKSVARKLIGDVTNKTVLLLDDIVDTGITAVQAAEMALAHGATRVVACFSHGVLSKGAVELLSKSPIEKIWVSNSIVLSGVSDIESKITVVSCDHVIADSVVMLGWDA